MRKWRLRRPVATATSQQDRPPGSMEGEIWMTEDFHAPLDDLIDCLKAHSEDPLDQDPYKTDSYPIGWERG